MFSNLKSAIQKITSKEKKEEEYKGEDIQAVIILLLEACQIDGETDEVEIEYINKLLINKFNLSKVDLKPYLPLDVNEIKNKVEVHYLGYYVKWNPQESYYYASEHSNFKARQG